jgi:transcriptional regulator with XRE-family HTH domain
MGNDTFLLEMGTRIAQRRKELHMTQEQLADKIGVTGSRVSNWEQGIHRPDVDILANICTALNVSPSELLDIHLNINELSAHEQKLLTAYREHNDLQRAVNILLGIEPL